jgi:hypothetical protein
MTAFSEVRLVLTRRPWRAARNFATTTTCPRFEGSAQLLVRIAGGLTRQSGHERHARLKEGANGFETDKNTPEGAHRFLPFLPLLSLTLRGFFVLSVSLATLVGLLLPSIEAGGDEFSMNRGRIPTLFTRVRGRGILLSSHRVSGGGIMLVVEKGRTRRRKAGGRRKIERCLST